jgi:hypothetical protein
MALARNVEVLVVYIRDLTIYDGNATATATNTINH